MTIPLLNGVVVAAAAIILVIGRVLWPKELMQRRRTDQRFQASVQEMRDGLDKLDEERYEDALALFKLAASQTPNKPAPVLLRIYALGLQGQQHEARFEMHSALSRWPVETLPKRLLALAYVGAGQYDRAYATATAAADEEPVVGAALLTLGDVCRLIERYPEAERAYDGAVKLGITRPYAGKAWVLAAQGRTEEAEAELADAPTTTLALFEAQLALAQIHLQARRLDDALNVYTMLLRTQSDVPRVLVPYGLALLESLEFREAERVLRHTVAISNENPFAQCALAAALIERNDLAGAIVSVREALRLWPGYGSARGVYGDILKRAGRYEAAEEQYREALRVNPFLADVHLRLAALLRAQGKNDAAREHEREAHRLRPTAPKPATQEFATITSKTLALTAQSLGAPPRLVVTRDTDPNDLDIELQPTAYTPVVSPPRHDETPAQGVPFTSSQPHFSDVAVFPGAILLFDEARDNVLTQTLQSNYPPLDVLTFYQGRMAAEGWQQTGQRPPSTDAIEGITLLYQRGGQQAYVTIGVPPIARQSYPQSEQVTYIITGVTLTGVAQHQPTEGSISGRNS